MAELTEPSLVFKVIRAVPELIPPAAPTPYEFKELSDIDDQEGLRFQIPGIFFYKNNEDSASRGRDPAQVIKEAVGKALVAYYPLAGRLREKAGRKLVVECNAEGVLFIEADAEVTLKEFGEELHLPIPCLQELLFDVPGSSGLLDTPLLLFQVTRLTCGGFILAVRLNHVIADAAGSVQFLNATTELACGAELSVHPVWERRLLCARDPPRVTYVHHEHDDSFDTKGAVISADNMVHKSFFFGPGELSALRRWVPAHLKSSSTFDVLTASLWRCRTIALEARPEELVHLICVVNARSRLNPPLPKGYYGNALAYPAALCTAKELLGNPLGYAIELIKKAKASVNDEYMRSLADLMVIKGRPRVIITPCSFQVSDVTRVGLDQLDYGWGLPVYSGNARKVTAYASFYVPLKNKRGERGILFPICLPESAMERFVKELNLMLSECPENPLHTLVNILGS